MLSSKKPEGVGSSQPQAARKGPGAEYTAEPSKDGRGKRDTSRAAFHAARDAGVLSKREQEVFSLLCEHPERDYTRAEIAKATKMTHGAACGRVHSLLEFGIVVETPRRTCSVTGGDAHGVRCK